MIQCMDSTWVLNYYCESPLVSAWIQCGYCESPQISAWFQSGYRESPLVNVQDPDLQDQRPRASHAKGIGPRCVPTVDHRERIVGCRNRAHRGEQLVTGAWIRLASGHTRKRWTTRQRRDGGRKTDPDKGSPQGVRFLTQPHCTRTKPK